MRIKPPRMRTTQRNSRSCFSMESGPWGHVRSPDWRQLDFPRVASSENVTKGSTSQGAALCRRFLPQGSVTVDKSSGLIPTRDRFPSSTFLFRTDDDRLLDSSVPVLAGVNKRPGHHMTPLPDAALQGPQLSLRKPAGVIPVQPLHQGLGSRIGLLLGVRSRPRVA
jgi:hypothetical protein